MRISLHSGTKWLISFSRTSIIVYYKNTFPNYFNTILASRRAVIPSFRFIKNFQQEQRLYVLTDSLEVIVTSCNGISKMYIPEADMEF